MKQTIDPWKYRRRAVFGTLAFCAVTVSYLVFRAPSDSLREQLALGLIGLAATVITGYVFGATLDDKWQKRPKLQSPEEPIDRPEDADA